MKAGNGNGEAEFVKSLALVRVGRGRAFHVARYRHVDPSPNGLIRGCGVGCRRLGYHFNGTQIGPGGVLDVSHY